MAVAHARWLVALAATVGCAQAQPPQATVLLSTTAPVLEAAPLVIDVHAPKTVPLGSTALGLDDTLVHVRITNSGNLAVHLGDVRVAFDVRRDGVRFDCPPQAEVDHERVAPLGPSETFATDLPLHCWTPLPGTYEAHARISAEGARTVAVPFRFEVTNGRGPAAASFPSRSGLYALAGGASRVLPVGDAQPDERTYHAVLVFVNASLQVLELPSAQVRLDVFRLGDPLPCTSERSLHSFAPMAPGAVHVERVPVTCLRDRRGPYEVRLMVALDDDSFVEAGRFRVKVTDDLGVIVPIP